MTALNHAITTSGHCSAKCSTCAHQVCGGAFLVVIQTLWRHIAHADVTSGRRYRNAELSQSRQAVHLGVQVYAMFVMLKPGQEECSEAGFAARSYLEFRFCILAAGALRTRLLPGLPSQVAGQSAVSASELPPLQAAMWHQVRLCALPTKMPTLLCERH